MTEIEITAQSARSLFDFTPHRKTAVTEISSDTVDAGTVVQTISGEVKVTAESYIGLDDQGYPYPIEKGVYDYAYETLPDTADVTGEECADGECALAPGEYAMPVDLYEQDERPVPAVYINVGGDLIVSSYPRD